MFYLVLALSFLFSAPSHALSRKPFWEGKFFLSIHGVSHQQSLVDLRSSGGTGTFRTQISGGGAFEHRMILGRNTLLLTSGKVSALKWAGSDERSISPLSQQEYDVNLRIGYSPGKESGAFWKFGGGLRTSFFNHSASSTSIEVDRIWIPYGTLALQMFPKEETYFWMEPEVQYLLSAKDTDHTVASGWSAGLAIGKLPQWGRVRPGWLDLFTGYRYESQSSQILSRTQHTIYFGFKIRIFK